MGYMTDYIIYHIFDAIKASIGPFGPNTSVRVPHRY